jgi:hypothetical protein
LSSLFLVSLVMVEPPPKQLSAVQTYGLYAVTLTWPRSCDSDLDLYVREPDGKIVWYAGKDATVAHLEHDDLGLGGTGYAKGPNFERTVIRGVQPGEYTVTVHVYQQNECRPESALVELWRLEGADRRIVSQRLRLRGQGDERTAFRWSLRSNGDTYGVNRLPANLVGR